MHVGGVTVFEGPPPPFAELLDLLRSRLHLVPRYRQKLAHPPLDTGRPLWVDDPNFNLEYHVRHTALPPPGSEEQLLQPGRRGSSPSSSTAPSRCGRCGSSRASRTARFALISKTHHALIDGIAGVDLATVLFDLDAGRRPRSRTPTSRGSPQREPSARRAAGRRGRAAWCAPAPAAGRRASRGDATPSAALRRARARPSRASARSPGRA